MGTLWSFQDSCSLRFCELLLKPALGHKGFRNNKPPGFLFPPADAAPPECFLAQEADNIHRNQLPKQMLFLFLTQQEGPTSLILNEISRDNVVPPTESITSTEAHHHERVTADLCCLHCVPWLLLQPKKGKWKQASGGTRLSASAAEFLSSHQGRPKISPRLPIRNFEFKRAIYI